MEPSKDNNVAKFARNPKREADKLKQRFHKISSRFIRAKQRQKIAAHLRKLSLPAFVIFGATFTGLYYSPWPPLMTLRHIAAYPNCSAARLVQLAPAKRGEPGYYLHHDRDRDGIACEPLPALRPRN
jgi:hypothetical protein